MTGFGSDSTSSKRGKALGTLLKGGYSVTLLIHAVIVLIVVGVLLWLINNYLPMASSIKSILNFVVIIAVILWLLKVFGIWNIGSLHG